VSSLHPELLLKFIWISSVQDALCEEGVLSIEAAIRQPERPLLRTPWQWFHLLPVFVRTCAVLRTGVVIS
jgi:hypothetical protein